MMKTMYVISFLVACMTSGQLAAEPTRASASQGATTAPRLTLEQARADVDVLHNSLRSAHYNLYVHVPKAEYDTAFRQARAQLTDSMTALDLVRELQPLVALGRIGHARIDFPVAAYIAAAQSGGTVLPFDIRIEGDRVFVTHSYLSGSAIAPGAELLTIGDMRASKMVAQVSRFISGERSYMINAQMERFFPRWLWLIRGNLGELEVRGIGTDLRPFTTRIQGHPIGEVEGKKSQWTEALSTREVRIINAQTAYLRPGPFYNDQGGDPMNLGPFRQFIDNAFNEILQARSKNLIIDLRFNPGGDNSFSDLMVAWFADRPFRFSDNFSIKASPQIRHQFQQTLSGKPDETGIVQRMAKLIARHKDGNLVQVELDKVVPQQQRFTGRVYVLVNRHSYSNATSAAAMIQDYGFGKIVGEETADLPTSYASSAQFTLPHSGLQVTYPKGYFVRPSKETSMRGVIPDLAIAPAVMRSEPGDALKATLEHVAHDTCSIQRQR